MLTTNTCRILVKHSLKFQEAAVQKLTSKQIHWLLIAVIEQKLISQNYFKKTFADPK